MLAAPLGALFDQNPPTYSGTSHHCPLNFLDLSESSKAMNVDEIINLDTSLLQTETTGEKIVRELQEWLLTNPAAPNMAVLPDDKIQRILVGVSPHKLSRFLFLHGLFIFELILYVHDFLSCRHVTSSRLRPTLKWSPQCFIETQPN